MTKRKLSRTELTTRGRHAVSAMLELAQADSASPLSLAQIAEKGNISLSYLEQLFSCLRRQKLVKSYRGPGGGYLLAKPAADISIAAILIAADTFLDGKKQKRKTDATYPGTKKLWEECSVLIGTYLDTISLDDVLQGKLPPSQH